MVGTFLMQSNWGKTEVSTFTGTLSELAGMITENTEANGKTVDITFTQDANYNFSFMLLKPDNATAENPAPAVICSHGRFKLQRNADERVYRIGKAWICRRHD